MCKQYPLNFHPELRIQYTDTEGDRIDVNSQLEWEEMFQELKNEKIIKIHIVEGKSGQYFKDGPAPSPLYLYETDDLKNQKTVKSTEPLEQLKFGVPSCLKELFPGKKILPHNIPAFLSRCISVTNLPNGEVDMDIDVFLLSDVLHQEGLKALNNLDYEKGKLLFSSLCTMLPNDKIAYYNLACCESLLGNVESALTYLKKAIELGWRDVNHMMIDADLTNVKTQCTHLFDQVCQLLLPKTPEVEKSAPVTQPPKETLISKPVSVVVTPVTPEPPKETPIPEPVPVVVTPVTPEPVPADIPQPVSDDIPFSQITDSMLMDPKLLFSGRSKWFDELNFLHELGFLSDSVLIPILEANKGSIEKTVQELLM